MLGTSVVDLNENLRKDSKKLGFHDLFRYPIDPKNLFNLVMPLVHTRQQDILNEDVVC